MCRTGTTAVRDETLMLSHWLGKLQGRCEGDLLLADNMPQTLSIRPRRSLEAKMCASFSRCQAAHHG